MDLKTKYLGLDLETPLVLSASPLSKKIDELKKMEDEGLGAVVLHSVFEEQIRKEEAALDEEVSRGQYSSPESLSFFPEIDFFTGPVEYLEHIRKVKAAVKIPVIASLNGSTAGGWTEYAKEIEQAGADAIELNIYSVPTNPSVVGSDIEGEGHEIVRSVKKAVSLPVAVKLSPFYTNLGNVADQLVKAGADGLVLFNRFRGPGIDMSKLELHSRGALSHPSSHQLPLQWIGILHDRVKADLAATGGLHDSQDLLEVLAAGATVTMLCSAIYRRGIPHIGYLKSSLTQWLTSHEYESLRALRGIMSQKRAPDPSAFERAQYVSSLQSYNKAGF